MLHFVHSAVLSLQLCRVDFGKFLSLEAYGFVVLFVSADVKRLIGRPWGDPSIQADMKHWPFEVLGRGGVPRIRINLPGITETFAPEEVRFP